jgi:hypothetical protein
MHTTVSPQGRSRVIIFCTAIITAFLCAIVTTKGLNPIDDTYFLSNVFDGRHFDLYIYRSVGRFFPGVGQEYVLASKLFGASAGLFRWISAIKMAGCAALLLYCLFQSGAGVWVVIILWSSVVFSVGFADASARLLVGELNCLLLILILIAALQSYGATPVVNRRHHGLVATGVAAIAIAFFYKEAVFTIALILGLSEFIRLKYFARTRAPKYSFALIALGAVYLIFYLIWRGPASGISYADMHRTPLLDVTKLFSQNDPMIVFVLLPLTLIRFVAIAVRRSLYTLYDSFLLAAIAYAGVFVVLHMYSAYYFLPCYGLAVTGLAGMSVSTNWVRIRNVAVALAGVFAVNNVPVAFSDAQMIRQIANNYSDFIDATTDWIWTHSTEISEPRNLVFAGTDVFFTIQVCPIHSGRFVPAKDQVNPR